MRVVERTNTRLLDENCTEEGHKKLRSGRQARIYLCCIWDNSVKARSLGDRLHHAVLFMIEPLTHSFLNDMASVDLLIFVRLLKRDESLVSSNNWPLGITTHQRTIWVGGPRKILPSAAAEVRDGSISQASCTHGTLRLHTHHSGT